MNVVCTKTDGSEHSAADPDKFDCFQKIDLQLDDIIGRRGHLEQAEIDGHLNNDGIFVFISIEKRDENKWGVKVMFLVPEKQK